MEVAVEDLDLRRLRFGFRGLSEAWIFVLDEIHCKWSKSLVRGDPAILSVEV